MKRISSGKPAPKILNTEFPQDRNSSAARKLRLDLTAVKGLAGLSAEQVSALGGQIRVRRFRKRAIIYSGKQSGDIVCIMFSGIARLTSVNRKNERVLLEVLGPGDVVCIPTLLPDVRHGLEYEAFTECEIGVLSAQALVETTGLEYASFFLALKLTMSRWWALLVRQSHFMDQTLEERIAVALLDLAEKFGLPDARGTIIKLGFDPCATLAGYRSPSRGLVLLPPWGFSRRACRAFAEMIPAARLAEDPERRDCLAERVEFELAGDFASGQ
jgi:CRP-like cAMP-binding protein